MICLLCALAFIFVLQTGTCRLVVTQIYNQLIILQKQLNGQRGTFEGEFTKPFSTEHEITKSYDRSVEMNKASLRAATVYWVHKAHLRLWSFRIIRNKALWAAIMRRSLGRKSLRSCDADVCDAYELKHFKLNIKHKMYHLKQDSIEYQSVDIPRKTSVMWGDKY